MNFKSVELIKLHEGLRLKPYKCSADKLTIGYGINLEEGITEEEAEYLLNNRTALIRERLENLDFWIELSGVRRAVLIDMFYNLGMTRFMQFRKMIAAIRARDYDLAAEEMKDSRWYRQVGTRSKRLCEMMKTDQWPDDL